ncbi:ubiquitin-conjugating enzyme [Ascodesmis nigricans]|uniref:Ubiquitin-conjugating enzyme n=1 Tax=Ascodesmis nigricans TaxID=341454 RepID=A0A4S2N0U4_9PEZI|nr:ubiquitin-conjugating enzyme [Ascodesmis nigricans]
MSTSTPAASRRLIKELTDFNKKRPSHLISLHPVDESDLTHWTATLRGPQDTPYEGGEWEIDIKIPDNYPNAPPLMVFVTPVCHPNVHPKTGEICLDLLRGTAWTPAYTLSTTLESVSQLLGHPEPDSPLNVDIAAVLRHGDRVAYDALVRVWAVMYAGKKGTTA